jgi:S-adenosylmethionine:tRNA ribosyltransferase-isomerase
MVDQVRLSELDYELPAERIAQRPLEERDASRMLLLDRRTGSWEDRGFREFPALLRGDELLVVNNTRVIPARLLGRRVGVRSEPPARTGRARSEFLQSPIEVMLLRRLSDDTWEALVRPGRKIGVGEKILFGDGGELEAEVEWRGEFGLRRLRLRSAGDLMQTIERLGHVPLPPYIHRSDDPADRERYQTIFAARAGAVAAPTAGLHFTPAILEQLRDCKIEIAEITLEVGLGTFEPIRTEEIEEHRIHREAYEIPQATAQAIARARGQKRPILAIGTTVVRALEDSVEKTGPGIAPTGAARAEVELVQPGRAEAEIFIYPGKPFRIVDQLLTNFHLPRSSLLAMVAALAGRENILRAYAHAVDSSYRFYSYGDCMLIR